MDYSLLLASVLTFVFTVLIVQLGLPLLRKFNARQEVREEGPKAHRQKSGTPTMGGVFMLFSVVIMSLFYLGLDGHVLSILFLFVGHGLLGGVDDGIKVIKKRNLGLRAKGKLFGQIFLGIVFVYMCTIWLSVPTTINIPMIGKDWDLGVGYYLFALLVIVGTANAVNLTDGLDGLAVGTASVAAATYVWIARGMGLDSVALFASVLAGACVGFLVHNYNPAKLFMGDTGSLALGGAFAGMAIITKTELILVVVGGVFVLEAMSVIIQVLSFKLRGKRVFRMSPIHHHFELCGWSETKVVHSFWLAGIGFAALGILLS